MSNSEQLRRAIVQKLESLHRSGVSFIPKSDCPAPLPARGVSTASPHSSPIESPIPKSAVTQVMSVTRPKRGIAEPKHVGGDGGSLASPLPAAQRLTVLKTLAEEVAQCHLCPDLAQTRTQTVFGVGNSNARLVFFGEAPGADEDRAGEPFVGKAGQLLTKIIEACQLKREDTYILNVLKCRPPANRNPSPDEAARCRPFFEKQLEVIQPEMICCLGAVAATTLLETTMSVGRLRGKFHQWRGIPVAVTYHPAYLLRNPAAKKTTWADMKMIMKELGVEL